MQDYQSTQTPSALLDPPEQDTMENALPDDEQDEVKMGKSSRKWFSLFGILSIAVFVAVHLVMNQPRYRLVAHETNIIINPEQAWVQQIVMPQDGKVRVTARDRKNQAFTAYWLSESAHQSIQAGYNVTTILVNNVHNQFLVNGGDLKEGVEQPLAKGIWYFYFESSHKSDESYPLFLNVKVERFY